MNNLLEKNEWLKISNDLFNLNLSDSERMDSIVLKVANELNIDTKSIRYDDLKNKILKEIAVTTIKKANSDEMKNENIVEEILEVTEENIVEKSIKEEPKVVYSELDNLRAECIMYGVGYGEKHTVSDLTQLLGQIRGLVPASMTIEEALKQLNPATSNESAPTMDTNNFELTLDNVDIIKENAPSQTNTSVSFQLETKKIAIPVATVKSNLEVYRGTFTQTIRGHFRPQTIQEINALFSHEYPFKHEIRENPKNELQIEIIFSMNGVDVRVPSDDKNDWIEIR